MHFLSFRSHPCPWSIRVGEASGERFIVDQNGAPVASIRSLGEAAPVGDLAVLVTDGVVMLKNQKLENASDKEQSDQKYCVLS